MALYAAYRLLECEMPGRIDEAVHLAVQCVPFAQQDAERAGCRERQMGKRQAPEPAAGLIG